MNARKLTTLTIGVAVFSGTVQAQVPDLLNAFDAGGRALGAGGALYGTSADTLSTFYNPAGLGYITKPVIGATYRNLPSSKTHLTGDASNPRTDTTSFRGNSTVAHLGYVYPLGEDGKRGVLGFSYNIGGYLRDRSTGTLSLGGPDTVTRDERLEAKADYYTIAYGKASGDQSMSYGFGLTFLQQHVSDKVNEDFSNGDPSQSTDNSEVGTGVGLLIGAQFNPRSQPNLSWGVSYRSQINLSGNSDTSGIYDRVPARLLAGVAYRQDGLRGGRDFAVFGAQIQHFFSATSGATLDRDAQTVAGFGMEYNYTMNGFRIPLRVGYNVVPGGGDLFGSRNSFTFGFGFRPNNSDYTLDLNFASPEKGGYDMSLGMSYRFGGK